MDMNPTLRLGILGMSEGNGHPYSWSAIINGYNPTAMSRCPFPVIPEYLSRQPFPEVRLPGAQVTHIWCDDPRQAEDVARAAYIPTVVSRFEQMIGAVDAVLLARDDAENHLHHAEPFLLAGIPILIDKPLALSVAEARRISDLAVTPNAMMSYTALRFAPELRLSQEQLQGLGPLKVIEGTVPKKWAAYAIHAIEPALRYLPHDDRVVRHESVRAGGTTSVVTVWKSGILTSFISTGTGVAPIRLTIYGAGGTRVLEFQDTFTAFRNGLGFFLDVLRGIQLPPNREELFRAISIVEAGI